jgi:hypothetical protein
VKLLSLYRKWILYSAILILVLINILLLQVVFAPTNNLLTKNITPFLTPVPKKTLDLCVPFSASKGKSSCEKAIKLVLEKLPVNIVSVKSATISSNMDIPSDTASTTKQDIWILTVSPNESALKANLNFSNKEIYVFKENGQFLETNKNFKKL